MKSTDNFNTCIEPPRRVLAVKVYTKPGQPVPTMPPPVEATRAALANARKHLGWAVKEVR